MAQAKRLNNVTVRNNKNDKPGLLKEALPEKAQLLNLYRQMLLIRRFEERAAEMYMLGKIRGFLHLYIGEEAVAVGSISVLTDRDYIVTHYRDHGHALARGMEPKVVMAELFGKATGCSKGKGGSMHLFDVSRKFMGGYAIVGGQMPIAVGLGLATKYRREDAVTVCYFGDGALNQGTFHESLNLASVWKLPVIFICENNGYGMGSRVGETFALREVYKLGEAYGVPSQKTDGMDVLAVREATQEAIEWAKSGHGPFFLEVECYRFRGHSMADPLDYRKKQEEERWRRRDPILVFPRELAEKGLMTEEERSAIEREVEAEVEEAVRFADESPEPLPDALYEDILAESG